MSFRLEPDPKLTTPDYWDGIDIEVPHFFDGEGHIPPVRLRPGTRAQAAECLSRCLYNVMCGDYEEVPAPIGQNGTLSDELDDGTVLVLDQEQLRGWQRPAEANIWPSDIAHNSPRITTPYAEYWRQNQNPGGDTFDFGVETAFFPERHQIYEHTANWAVLLAQGNKRVLGRTGLADAVADRQGVAIPLDDSYLMRGREVSSLPVREAQAEPEMTSYIVPYSIRTINRVKAMRIIRH